MTDFQPRRENLVRAMAPGTEMRVSDDGGKPRLSGHFARFNTWNLIDSAIEGRFLERIAPGAFTKTFAEKTPKIQFNHGKDPAIGEKVIAARGTFGEDDIGPTLDGELLDGLDPLLVSGLRAGEYGMSYRFSVPRDKDEWVRNAKPSDYNPEGLPERTMRELMVYEAGPVTWPADAGTDVAVRSLTDLYTLDALTADPERLAALIEAKQGQALATQEPTPVTPAERAADPPPAAPTVITQDPPEGGSSDSRGEPVADQYLTREDKAARITELKASVTARATEYPGVFPSDVQATDDAENREIDDLTRDIAAWDARQERVRQLQGDEARTEQPYQPAHVNVQRTRQNDIYDLGEARSRARSLDDLPQIYRDNAMRSLDASSFAHSTVDQARAKEGVQGILDNHDHRSEIATRMLLTGSPQYKRAFAESIQVMRPNARLEEARAAALAVTGTTTTGGYMLPYTFDPTFIKTGAWTRINPYRQICRVEQITGSNNWQGVSVGAVPAIYETEALAVTEAGPTFARPSLTAQRASSFVSISYETLQDRPDVVSEIADLIQEGKDTLEEAQFSVGVGTTVYPLGMFVKSTFTVKETITDNTFAVADLDATEAALPIRHRADAVWMLSRAVIRIVQGWETAYGKYFASTLGYPAVGELGQNPGGNTGLRLLGYPVWETPSAPVTVTGDDTIVGILVSPKNYMILDRVGMNVELIQNLVDGDGKPTGQRGILALWRNTAKALNADAGRQININ